MFYIRLPIFREVNSLSFKDFSQYIELKLANYTQQTACRITVNSERGGKKKNIARSSDPPPPPTQCLSAPRTMRPPPPVN